MSTRLSTAEARTLLGGIARSTLWRWYADCRVVTTGSRKPAIAWDRDKLEQRRKLLERTARRSA